MLFLGGLQSEIKDNSNLVIAIKSIYALYRYTILSNDCLNNHLIQIMILIIHNMWNEKNSCICCEDVCVYVTTYIVFLGKLIVMSYNVLCDKYATRQMYGYCPNWALSWNYRKGHIMNEILHYRADIICLQVMFCLLCFINCNTLNSLINKLYYFEFFDYQIAIF